MIVLAAASSSTSVLDEPGTLGFLVVFGLGIIVYFLLRSMNKHLRKVNDAARAEAARADADPARAEADPARTQTRPAGNAAPPPG